MGIDALTLAFMKKIAKNAVDNSESGGGTSDYSNLENKPTINGIELSGNKTAEDLGLKEEDCIVTFTYNSDEHNYSADKTVDVIYELYASGKNIVGYYDNGGVIEKYIPSHIEKMGGLYLMRFKFNGNDTLSYKTLDYQSLQTNDTWTSEYKEEIADYYTPGGIKADPVTEDDTIPVKINSEDGKAYVPTYPTLESLDAQPKDFLVTFTVVLDGSGTISSDRTFAEIEAAYTSGKRVIGRYSTMIGFTFELVSLIHMDTHEACRFINLDTNPLSPQSLSYTNESGEGIWTDDSTDYLPTSDSLGGIIADPKTENDTIPVNVDSDGRLWVATTTGGDTVNVDSELKEYMNVAKPAIASAIINKGGNVEDTDSLSDYATRITAIPNNISAAETIPNQTTLIATGLNDSVGIKLNWTDVGASGYLILRKENAKPTTSADGTIVYNGTYASTGYTDTDVQKGKVYYYRIFCRNSKNQYQSTETGAVTTVDYKDRTGQTLISDLPLGTKIKFGEWNGSEYFWEIIDTQDKNKGYVTCAADQNLGNRMFDAPETNNPVTNRKNQGNNRWLYSAVRQLLNSSEVAGSWWTAQHEYDVAPSYATQIDGFLKDFTTYEKNIIVSKTNRCNLDTNDGGGSETMIDKVWLPSSYAMSLELFQPLEDEHTYEAYTDNASRVYQSNWWLRTINGSSSASGVRYVNSYGALGSNSANYNYAVRPFCLLPTSAYMLWSDSDEAYVFADDSQRNPTI